MARNNSVTALAHQAAVHPTTIVGDPIDCRPYRKVTLFLFHGYVEATADTNAGSFLVQVRPETYDSTVKEHWVTLGSAYAAAGGTPDTEAMTATEPVGETVLACASTTGFAVGDLLYIQDANTLEDSEWGYLQEFAANTSVTLLDGLATAKDSSDVIWNDASKDVVSFDCDEFEAFRVVWTHEGATGANGHVKALACLGD